MGQTMGYFKGITHYTVGTVTIGFPEDDVRCALCPCLQTYSRNQCMITGELVPDTKYIGYRCPMLENLRREPIENQTAET